MNEIVLDPSTTASRLSIFGIDQRTLALAASLAPLMAREFTAGYQLHCDRSQVDPILTDAIRRHIPNLIGPISAHMTTLFQGRFDNAYAVTLRDAVSHAAQTPFSSRAHLICTLAVARIGFAAIGRKHRFS